MATSDRTISKPIVNVLTKAQYQGISSPSEDQFYLITDDASVSAGTGISVNSAGGETTVSLDTSYAVTGADIIAGTDTTNKLVSAKTIADAIEAGGGGGGGGSGTVTSVTAGEGLNTTSADTTTDGGSIITSGTLYLSKLNPSPAGTYGSASSIPSITVDKHGRVTAASGNSITIPQGTVTSVRVQATSPVQSSTNTAQSTSLNTTISLADAYGDTKNPYAAKPINYVLAGNGSVSNTYSDLVVSTSETTLNNAIATTTLSAGTYMFSGRVTAQTGGTRSGQVWVRYNSTSYDGNTVTALSTTKLDGVSYYIFTLTSSTSVSLNTYSTSSLGFTSNPITWTELKLSTLSSPSFRALKSDDLPSIGNITNTGDITTNATIASGDRLIINDESAGAIANSSITFGTSTTTYLRNDGTWGTPSGGGGGGGSYTATAPIDITSDVISHDNSGVTADTYNMSQDTTTGNIYIPQFTVDAKGHITAASENTDYIPVMSSSTNYSGLLSKDDYNKISNYLGLESPHFVCSDSYGGSYSFSTSNGTTTDSGYGVVSVTISLPYYNQTSNDIGLSNYYITPQIVDVYFRRSTTRTSWYNDGDAYIQASGYQRIDFDWICTSFSYNSTNLTWQATLYIYYDPSLAGTKSSYSFWPVIKGYSGK